MKNNWQMDERRALRPPTDAMQDAAGFVGSVFLFFLAVAILGCILNWAGIGDD
jgi:hypothetical protein